MKNHSGKAATLVAITILLSCLFLIGCSSSGILVPATNTPTVALTPTPSLPPTLPPSPSPTAIPLMSEEEMENLDQQFYDFLNKEGEFTEEKTASMMMDIDLESDEASGLGLTDNIPRIQGYFFRSIDVGDYIILFFGFDGADGNRFITPIEIPAYFFDFIQQRAFRVDRFYKNFIGDWHFVGTSETTTLYSREQLNSFFTKNGGKVFGLELCRQIYEIDDRIKGIGEIAVTYVNNLNARTDFTYGLFELVTSNGYKYDVSEGIKSNSTDILRITSINNIGEIDDLKMPEVFSVCYFDEQEMGVNSGD